MKRKEYFKEKEKDYYICDRCNIDSLGKKWCPCPRGSCEAIVVGKLKITKQIIYDKQKTNRTP